MNSIQREKSHFDDLSNERAENGFVPDLDRMGDCDFFYLSPFRRKALANLALRRSTEFMIGKLVAKLPRGAKVLDLGCGSGWFSLELAKAGFQVTAVDLSEASIALARQTLRGANLGAAGGSVTHTCADLNTWQVDSPAYDAVCYVGSLHHLDNPAAVAARIKASLKPRHYLVAHEPLSHNNGEVEAAFAVLIRTLLSAFGAWYERIPVPGSKAELAELLTDVQAEYVNWADKSEGCQSPMNNSSDGGDNLAMLCEHYDVIDTHDELSLQLRLIGGIRAATEAQNVALARFIIDIEDIFLSHGALKPGARVLFGISKP